MSSANSYLRKDAGSTEKGKIWKISPLEIMNAIKEASLLQREDFIKHYKGMHVKWQGEIISIEKKDSKGNTAIIYISIGQLLTSVRFEVELNDYPGIGVLKEGTKVTVDGCIENIDSIAVELVRVKMQF